LAASLAARSGFQALCLSGAGVRSRAMTDVPEHHCWAGSRCMPRVNKLADKQVEGIVWSDL